MSCLRYRIPLLLAVAVVGTGGCNGSKSNGSKDGGWQDAGWWDARPRPDSDHPRLVVGKCGLEGRMVECMATEDCYSMECFVDFGLPDEVCNWSNLDGVCVWTGGECGSADTGKRCGVGVCVSYHCYRACNTHGDCEPGQMCICLALFYPDTPAAGFCVTPRCNYDSVCPDGSEPVPDSLGCRQLVFEGDCHWVPGSRYCPPGYEFEGEHGCRMVEPYAWMDPDAGVP